MVLVADGHGTAEDRWYQDFFDERFWTSVELPDHGVELGGLIAAETGGTRVLDVASGVGDRAIVLAAHGYEVFGLDVSPWAVAEAARRAHAAHVHVQWLVGDPLGPAALPPGSFDAALCIDCVGWGTDTEQLRLFRRLRRTLSPGGLLIAGRTPAWLGLAVARGVEQDLRVFTPAELQTLVRRAGFEIVDDGQWLVARALQAPPHSLAVASWRTPAHPGLDLRYAPDEAELLTPTPHDVWEALVRSVPDAGADAVGRYAVDDPYGAERGQLVVGGYIGRHIPASQLTFAAGVTSLLHDLVGLADGGRILAPAIVHGDLESWAVADGCDVELIDEPADAEAILARLAARPALVHLDRPTFAGDLLELDELELIAVRAAEVGAPVVVDESALPYLGGPASGATLAQHTDNLVVLRGFTKAYSLGGLRVAWAVASRAIAARVRELVAPLQVDELALQAAFRLLAEGDVFARLRARAAEVKPEVVALLEDAGFDVRPGRAELPWVAVADPDGAAARRLEQLRILPLQPVRPPQAPARPGGGILRLTLPLAEDRLDTFRRLLRSPGEHDGDRAAVEQSSNT